jgi:hypothetical protein
MNRSVGWIVPEIDLAAQGTTVKEDHHDREVLAAVRPNIRGYEIPVIMHPHRSRHTVYNVII